MPNFNKHTKKWTYTVEVQSKHDLDDDDLIYMDDEENNFGQEYEYGSEEDSDEEEDSEEEEEVVESSVPVISFRNKSRRRFKKSSDSDSDSEDFDSDFYKEMEENQKQINIQDVNHENLTKVIIALLKKQSTLY